MENSGIHPGTPPYAKRALNNLSQFLNPLMTWFTTVPVDILLKFQVLTHCGQQFTENRPIRTSDLAKHPSARDHSWPATGYQNSKEKCKAILSHEGQPIERKPIR